MPSLADLAKRHLALLPGALVLAAAGPAGAHPLAPSLWELVEGEGGAVLARFKRPLAPSEAARPEPRVPASCDVRSRETGFAEAGSTVETWRLACDPPGLAGRTLEVAGLDEGDRVVVRVERADGGTVRGLLSAAEPRFVVPERESPGRVLASYGRLGFEHILAGADHLLFVLGLVFLAGTGRRLLLTITAFTVGHSVTLGLAALEVVRLAPGPVEIGIAASLLWLAVELTRPGPSLRRASAPLAAGFGLLHGLGFAGALQAAGLPAGAVPLALLGFNLGIEAGQLAFVAALLAAAGLARAALGARAQTLTRPLRVASAYALGSVAAFWVFERLAALA